MDPRRQETEISHYLQKKKKKYCETTLIHQITGLLNDLPNNLRDIPLLGKYNEKGDKKYQLPIYEKIIIFETLKENKTKSNKKQE